MKKKTRVLCLCVAICASTVLLAQTPGLLRDDDVTRLIAALDTRLTARRDPSQPVTDPRFSLWDFARQFQSARLSAAQEARVLRHLDGITKARPADAAAIASARFMLSALSVGKTAPDIVGRDLDGVEFKLSDYRGRVVLLVFTGDWCGACRAQYPIERLLAERYKDAPFTLLAVDSSQSLESARKAKTAQQLPFRAWWDGGGATATTGPIASAWNVVGWPSLYVLDTRGVIQLVDVRATNS